MGGCSQVGEGDVGVVGGDAGCAGQVSEHAEHLPHRPTAADGKCGADSLGVEDRPGSPCVMLVAVMSPVGMPTSLRNRSKIRWADAVAEGDPGACFCDL